MSSFASKEDLRFESIMSRPVNIIVFRLNELMDREGFGYESGLEGVTGKFDELPIWRMFLDNCTNFLVEMGNETSLSKNGLSKEVEVLLTFLLKNFDKARIWISGASLTYITTFVDDYFFDDFRMD